VTYAELFAGAGGLSLGLEAAGFRAAAHAEIEPHARAVLRHRWPDTRLDGDVMQINGADYTGITLLSGGSPCQDLSVAGKRAGLTGSRSSLFHQQVRIWQESGAPYFLWENVLGALSSNNGADFATVLSTIVGSTVTVPADGWRGGGGVVAGRDAVAAFRVLDLQHFGPPQRRVRVFILAARAGGVDPAEVLALREGVCGHPSPRQQSREGVAARAGGGVEGGVALNISNGIPTLNAEMGTLDRRAGGSGVGAQTRGVVIAFYPTQNPISGDVSPAVGRTTDGMGVFVDPDMKSWKAASVIEPMCARDYKDAAAIVVGNSGMESWKTVDVAIGLAARDAKGTNNVVIGSLDFGGHGGSYNGQDAYQGRIRADAGRPRRLTPLECERLMSWPDQWTATGRKENGTEYALSDTARYRLCGNGVGSVCAEWIGRRLKEAIA
jgi:DNA (cytosine-5)-methyltransferase 1